MRFVVYTDKGREGLAVRAADGQYRGYLAGSAGYPGSLETLIEKGGDALSSAAEVLLEGSEVDLANVEFLPPLSKPSKIACIGLNYADHSKESGFEVPTYPTVFARFPSSLIGHGQPILRPPVSTQLDYEGEVVAVIGKGGRHISREAALDHVAGYSLFNDASIRDYQFKSPQWTVGKNFDATGAFGPEFVTADELPPGAKGLKIQTRLNGQIVQDGSTDDLIFDVGELIAILSEAMSFVPGDLIVTGTPAGVGFARKPPLFMKAGDVCEIEVDGLGILRNPVADEVSR